MTCGNCPACLERTNARLRVPPARVTLPGDKPTTAALKRHAEKFGPELVNETAAHYGLGLRVKPENWREKRDRLKRRRRR